MYCAHLSLANFRNYVRLELELSPGVTIVQGDNAQGKTNLLEAIFFLATTRSPRTSVDREMIHWLALKEELPFARVAGRVHRSNGDLRVDVTMMFRDQREVSAMNGNGLASLAKRIRINDIPRRAVELIGQVNVVMFSPQDIDLVAGTPSQRRRYLDITNSQIDSSYVRELQRYNRVLAQRNHLLRLIREHRARPDQMPYWNEQLIESGSYVIAQRQHTIFRLNELLQQIHPRLTGRVEHLNIAYLSTVPLDGLDAKAERAEQAGVAAGIRERFNTAMGQMLEKEIHQGVSLVGPHRDDLQFLVDRADMNIYGSRGQQRTTALATKLAETQLILAETGEQPILLLDDVLSELDARRRGHLLESICPDQQVLATATDLDHFTPNFLAQANLLQVEQGRVFHPTEANENR